MTVAAADAPPAPWRRDAAWLIPLFALLLCKQLLLVAIIGPFSGHDEVDHFFYIARFAKGDGLGEVGEVVLPSSAAPYRAYVADYPLNAEVIQPPLYHVALAPLYLVIPGEITAKLYALRLVSVLLGLVVVWLVYQIARLLFPTEPLLVAGVPIFVALQPQVSFEAAIVNHDVLLIALVTGVLYLLLRGVRDGFAPRLMLGIAALATAGLWTKVSFALIFPVIGVAQLMAWSAAHWPVRALVTKLGLTIGLPLALATPWLIRSLVLYGDPTGAVKLRELSDFGEQAMTYGEMLTSKPFWRQILQDAWGNYGWRQVPLEPLDYQVIWWVWAAALAGLVLLAGRALLRPGGEPLLRTPFQRQGVLLLVLTAILFVYGILYVGTLQFTQARFAFPAVAGFAVLTLLGIAGWLPVRFRPLALPVLTAALLALQVYVALRYLIPFYYGSADSQVVLP